MGIPFLLFLAIFGDSYPIPSMGFLYIYRSMKDWILWGLKIFGPFGQATEEEHLSGPSICVRCFYLPKTHRNSLQNGWLLQTFSFPFGAKFGLFSGVQNVSFREGILD